MSSASPSPASPSSTKSAGDGLVTIKVGRAVAHVAVASTPEERAKGLSGRKSLGKDEGMLFLFAAPARLSFWMKDTEIPLSIAFITSDGKIAEIQDMEPGTLDTHDSHRKAMMALEMRRGWFKRNHVAPGDVIVLGDTFFVDEIR